MGILDIFDKFKDAIILKEDCELERKVKYLEDLKNSKISNDVKINSHGKEIISLIKLGRF